ncbi:MAG: hypothetical protein ABEJ72_09890, partial [Candidatus Aenigmatarchaeota archaeon]
MEGRKTEYTVVLLLSLVAGFSYGIMSSSSAGSSFLEAEENMKELKSVKYGMENIFVSPAGNISLIGNTSVKDEWADYTGVHSFKVTINRKGLRGPDFSREKPSNTTRILVVGDSFTFGLGVNMSDVFTERL